MMVIERDSDHNLEKDNRYLRLKNVQGKSVSIVREVYRRDSIPCQSSLCLGDCNTNIGKLIYLLYLYIFMGHA